jgi:hypothetical protein
VTTKTKLAASAKDKETYLGDTAQMYNIDMFMPWQPISEFKMTAFWDIAHCSLKEVFDIFHTE